MSELDTIYDVVIVGAGQAGAIVAREMAEAGKSVLILEAGDNKGRTWEGYQSYMDQFRTAEAKVPNAPYPDWFFAPSPTVLNLEPVTGPPPTDTSDYYIQMGPQPFSSDYNRNEGGTMLHWMGTCLRMLPHDFEVYSRYGVGRDWPIKYEELRPYYQKAEFEIGVSADVEDQSYLGIEFAKDYVYPMHKIPASYWDKTLKEGTNGMKVEIDNNEYDVVVTSTPAGRNGMPNTDYENKWAKPFNKVGKGYVPVGAVGNQDMGQRCEGNTNCTPICPVQAKYNAIKTLAYALTFEKVEIRNYAVVQELEIDPVNARISGVKYTEFTQAGQGPRVERLARGRLVVMCAHAAENAKILLQSNAANSSDQVGRNLMDHPVLLTWGLMPQKVGSYRGPISTSGIESLRDGEFRRRRSAFRVEIGNEGWNWPTGAPYSTVSNAVDTSNMFGAQLRKHINGLAPRQFRFGALIEQLPSPSNRVTIDTAYRDAVGNYKPVIHYTVNDYERAGFEAFKRISDQIFARLGAEDFSQYNPSDPGYVQYNGMGYSFQGAGHLAGTHLMGDDPKTSVVDKWQRSWDHSNLYLVGCGSMPTVATSNPTLTLSALAFMSCEEMLRDLNK